jgi:hypothetical protein
MLLIAELMFSRRITPIASGSTLAMRAHGARLGPRASGRFVVQQHDATTLHFGPTGGDRRWSTGSTGL